MKYNKRICLVDWVYLRWGGISCQYYAEFEHHQLALSKLELAWQKVVQRHPMLRAVISDKHKQRVLSEVPAYKIETADLRQHDRQAVEQSLLRTGMRMSQQTCPADLWPLFEIRAHLLPGKVRLHFSIDLLMVDVFSLLILFRDWFTFYQDLDRELPKLELGFRDYVLAEQKIPQSAVYKSAFAYWQKRLSVLAPAPQLPLAKKPQEIGKPLFTRRSWHLPKDKWTALKALAAKARVTPSMVLCTAFAQTLKKWGRSHRFTLSLTLFNRWLCHPQVNSIVGDFTYLCLLEMDLEPKDSFLSIVRRTQKQFFQDLEHCSVNGVQILREIHKQQQTVSRGMPIVFTSALGLPGMQSNDGVQLDWLGEQIYSVSQTPQVWLDCQVLEQGEVLYLSWDAVDELFPPQMLDDMFDYYGKLLSLLAQSESVWHYEEDFIIDKN